MDMMPRPLHTDPLATPPPAETIVTNAARVVCDGDERGGDGHPRVWLQLGADGSAECGYCDRRFVLAGSAADPGQ